MRQSWCVEGDCVAWSSPERRRKKPSWVTRCDVVLCCLSFLCHTLFLSSFLLPSFAFAPPPPPPRPVESDNTLRIKNEKTRSLLLFTNVTEKHFGNYTCFASNRLGASNASMLLFRKLSHRTTCRCMHTMAQCTHVCTPKLSQVHK